MVLVVLVVNLDDGDFDVGVSVGCVGIGVGGGVGGVRQGDSLSPPLFAAVINISILLHADDVDDISLI